MKNKTIIALQGDQNRGKTETLSLLFKFAIEKGFEIVIDKKKKTSKDFFVIIKKYNIQVGICTYGDKAYLIRDRCNIFINAGCSIMVCACHNKGVTFDIVNSFIDYTPEFIKKTIGLTGSEYDNVNKHDADNLLKRINSLIGKTR